MPAEDSTWSVADDGFGAHEEFAEVGGVGDAGGHPGGGVVQPEGATTACRTADSSECTPAAEGHS